MALKLRRGRRSPSTGSQRRGRHIDRKDSRSRDSRSSSRGRTDSSSSPERQRQYERHSSPRRITYSPHHSPHSRRQRSRSTSRLQGNKRSRSRSREPNGKQQHQGLNRQHSHQDRRQARSRSASRDRRKRSRSPDRHKSRSRDIKWQQSPGRDRQQSHSRHLSPRSQHSRENERYHSGVRGRYQSRDRHDDITMGRGRNDSKEGRSWDEHDRERKRSRYQQQQQQQQWCPEVDRQGFGKWDRAGSTADRQRAGCADQQREPAQGFGGQRDGRRQPAAPLTDGPPDVGSIHHGKVQTIKPFGIFVAIEGYRRHVLVHHTQVSEEVVLTRSDEDDLKVKALEYAATPGQQVWVKVLEVSFDQSGAGFKVHGSMRVVDQQDGHDLDPTGQLAAGRGLGGGGSRLSDEPPEVGTRHRAEVKRIEAYGVFVALQGYRKYGLVHASQVANYLEFSAEDSEADRKKALSELVEVGQDVWVKVVEVTEDDKGRGPKVGCSMKLVDQTDGTDLDPQNLRYRPRGDGGGEGHGRSKAPIGAGAGEVKGGAIDWGYLATRPDAFGSAGYDLLHDDAQEQRQQRQPASGPDRPAAQPLPPAGRGRSAVVPAWMTQQQQQPAAPGSQQQRVSGDAPVLTVEEALRIVQAATAKDKKKHKDKHKKHYKHKKHKSHKDRKGSKKQKSHKDSKQSHSSSSSGSRSDVS